MINDAQSKLQDGYKRLISFETQTGGDGQGGFKVNEKSLDTFG
jgi:hypothetical protein